MHDTEAKLRKYQYLIKQDPVRMQIMVQWLPFAATKI